MNKKKIIITTIIIVIIAIILLTVLLIINSKNAKYAQYGSHINEGNQRQEDENVKAVTNATNYFSIENAVQKYLDYVDISMKTQQNLEGREYIPWDFKDEEGIETEDQKKQAIYNILDTSYIKNNNITTNNIYDFVGSSQQKHIFTAMKMNYITDSNIEKYSVYGRIINEEQMADVKYGYFIVTLDTANNTFMIEPILNSQYKDISQISLEKKVNSIDKNANNEFEYKRLEDKDVVIRYLTDYKQKLTYDVESAYNALDEEYRNKRFGSLEEYKKYVIKNKGELDNIAGTKYLINTDNGATEYVCIDQYGNYYIFKTNAVLQYTLQLDTYTLTSEKFTKEYQSATEQEKVAMNIDKFVQMLNNRDYKAAYTVLNDAFKQNYFKTQDDFENYMRQILPSHYKLEFGDFTNENQTFIQKIKLIDIANEQNVIEKNIIMRLDSGENFVMSFNI